jgi:hypothetical protein
MQFSTIEGLQKQEPEPELSPFTEAQNKLVDVKVE